ncbi:hypothetical protein F7P10_30195 [Actinomadura sp. WMMB 499]|nr:hypothetical protein F7P10_30195 [Actinomadura sp. WMMB 499]
MGGSIGGLAAARELSGRYERVTVLDRDVLPDEPADRRGVPQMGHAHALLISGRMRLEEMFPGLADELITAGAVPFDPGYDLLFYQMGALRTRYRSGMRGISVSRAFLELSIRRRVADLPNVTIRDRTAVNGLYGVTGQVHGVELDGGERIAADLVVDATGRAAGRSDRWLEPLGCPAPEVTTVKIDVGYTTRLLRRKPGDALREDGGMLFLMSCVPPHDKRAAAAFAVEGDRWMITLGGWHRAHAPADPEGFAEFAAGLPDPHMANLLANSEPLDEGGHKFVYPAARRRHFEKLSRLPGGYVALGDAICSFNPLYGQGMTVATMEARELGACLDRFGAASPAMARRYYRAAGKVIDAPWQLSTGSDFMFPETVGKRPPGTDLLNKYVRRIMLASHVSTPAHHVMMEVQHLLAPPASIMRPATVVRALRAARRSPAAASDTPHPAGVR